jgi:short-subunit dehydrogenase
MKNHKETTEAKHGPAAVIMGASSGIGMEVARLLLRRGWHLGLAARSTEPLAALSEEYPGLVKYASIDITETGSEVLLRRLIDEMEEISLYLHVSGVGWQNMALDADKELTTVQTNALGFTRMVGEAYRYFAARGEGHIAVVSSIAGTKGIGAAPAYSATKAFDATYIEALEQQAHMRGKNIHFTDIRPGFVRTALLGDGRRYPLLMSPEAVARAIVGAVLHRRHVVVIDWRYRLLTALWRCVPRWLWRRMKVSNG